MPQESHGIIQEANTVAELRLLRQLMAEGQGIVQQQLDELKAACKESTKALASCKKEVKRQNQRQERLKNKFRVMIAEMGQERRRCEGFTSYF